MVEPDIVQDIEKCYYSIMPTNDLEERKKLYIKLHEKIPIREDWNFGWVYHTKNNVNKGKPSSS